MKQSPPPARTGWRVMRLLLLPQIASADLRPIFCRALLGGLVAGVYGALHDQATYSLAPEYFTKMKFAQFAFVDVGLGDRVFVSTIGFLATAWIGFIATWFFARRDARVGPRGEADRRIGRRLLWMAACAFAAGIFGYVYGSLRAADVGRPVWGSIPDTLGISDRGAFLQVACVHDAGYIGAIVGFLLALFSVRPSGRPPQSDPAADSRQAADP